MDEVPKTEKPKIKDEVDTEDPASGSRKRRHNRVKVRKKDKVGSDHQPDKRQKMELKGPRVKHVCRSASIVLGQPIATFPLNDDKETSDHSDDNSAAESEKVESKEVEPKIQIPDICSDCDPVVKITMDHAIDQKVCEEVHSKDIIKDEESTDSYDSLISTDTNKENDLAVCKVNFNMKEDSESKSNDDQALEVIQRKPKQALGNLTNVCIQIYFVTNN